MNEIGEAELTSALRDGGMVDGAAEGGRRVARAGVLRKCLRGIQDQADPGGLRLENVFVAGRFDLTGLVIPFPLRFHGCEFGTAPVLEGAQLFELALRDSPHLPGLLANGLRVQRDLDLSGSSVTGVHWTSTSTSKPAAIWLGEARIGGRLLCAGTAIDGQGSRSIHADRLQVAGAIRFIQGFTSSGEIRLHAARLESSLDLNGAQITSLNGPALDLENADITAACSSSRTRPASGPASMDGSRWQVRGLAPGFSSATRSWQPPRPSREAASMSGRHRSARHSTAAGCPSAPR